MIQRTVTFRLAHPAGSNEQTDFLATGCRLAGIPRTHDVGQFRQVSGPSDHTSWFAVRFDDQATDDASTTHPFHVRFVGDRWVDEVASFKKLDFVAL